MNIYQDQQKINYLLNFYTLNQIEKYCGESKEKLDYLWDYSQPQEVEIQSLKDNIKKEKVYTDSPDGWVEIIDCIKKEPKKIFLIELKNGYSIKASFDHLFQNNNNEWIFTIDLRVNEYLITDIGISEIINITSIGTSEVYDLSIDHPNHRYYTAGICSHNSGKSLFLQNLAVNWSLIGLNTIYISLELSEDLIGLRLDAMLTQRPTKQIFKDMEDVALRLGLMAKQGQNGIKPGKIQIKKMPEAGTSTNVIRAYLKEYEIQTGIKPDAVLVDYLDLLYSNNNKVDINNTFAKDKYISEELRALAFEWNIFCVSASQLNRSSINEQDFDMSHIAGGISKVNTADNLMGIFTTPSMKERGEYQVQFLKTRSSSGVGSKVSLSYDPNCLRISDFEEGSESSKESSFTSVHSQMSRHKNQIKIETTQSENKTTSNIEDIANRLRAKRSRINND